MSAQSKLSNRYCTPSNAISFACPNFAPRLVSTDGCAHMKHLFASIYNAIASSPKACIPYWIPSEHVISTKTLSQQNSILFHHVFKKSFEVVLLCDKQCCSVHFLHYCSKSAASVRRLYYLVSSLISPNKCALSYKAWRRR
jgi:hypothetical protein